MSLKLCAPLQLDVVVPTKVTDSYQRWLHIGTSHFRPGDWVCWADPFGVNRNNVNLNPPEGMIVSVLPLGHKLVKDHKRIVVLWFR